LEAVVAAIRDLPWLIFDGDCGFCTTSARFATRWVDRRDRYDRLDALSAELVRRYREGEATVGCVTVGCVIVASWGR